MGDVSRETLEQLLPAGVDPAQLQEYHDILAGEAVTLGLMGPREADRIWDRHLANALWVVVPQPGTVPLGSSVADVGSGAGLPGLAWAIARPDITVALIEPLLRRAEFLSRVVHTLQLADRVTVIRARAESITGQRWQVVTARAVAPLDRLLGWTAPLVEPGGRVVAIKGATAQEEVTGAAAILRRLQLGRPRIEVFGAEYTATPTRVVIVPRLPAVGG